MAQSLSDKRMRLHRRLINKGKSPQQAINIVMEKLPGLTKYRCAHYHISEYSEGESGCTYKDVVCVPNSCEDFQDTRD